MGEKTHRFTKIPVLGDIMKLFSYVIPRDFGFAPNPYFNYCTLATCKPRIRKTAQIGDWVAAFGAANTTVKRKLVMLMNVEEILTFDEYWNDERFLRKRPIFNRGGFCAYGDNIYHHIDGQWLQEPSHHSMADGSINYVNLMRDTKADRVLIAQEYYYFGNNAVDIPEEFTGIIKTGRNHIVVDDNILVNRFLMYMRENYEIGIHGVPYSKKSGTFVQYKGEQ